MMNYTLEGLQSAIEFDKETDPAGGPMRDALEAAINVAFHYKKLAEWTPAEKKPKNHFSLLALKGGRYCVGYWYPRAGHWIETTSKGYRFLDDGLVTHWKEIDPP